MKHWLNKSFAIILSLSLLIIGTAFPVEASAVSSKTYIAGKVYEFDKDNDYKFSEATEFKSSDSTTTYGQFSILGSTAMPVAAGKKSGVEAYSIKEGTISISYTYSNKLLRASNDEWHLVEDKEKNVDIYKLNNNIQKGALILQRSIDHLNWNDISIQTNAFENTPVQNGSMYDSLDVELINGCYYRLIVVYELTRKVDTSKYLWVISHDEYETKRIAEVYELYAKMDNEHVEELRPNTKRYRLGETTRVKDFASYSGSEAIKGDDIHYNWVLGDFFVSGFTSTSEKNGVPVFLKNVGDVVTLWFNLKQDINAINNDKNVSVTADNDGFDQYFQTPRTDFGRGMLIIRYTDYENVRHESVMYKDYLEANTSLGTNTRVQLFEEGDYEVALDYEITKDQLVDKVGHYRIFFKFSVRNANCMVYPFDVVTGAELTNSSVTPNGFALDLAKSRYLKIYIEKEVWTEGADGLTKDTRFNSTAKDGDKYTSEGIYTITVENQYTGLKTKKVIYVGTNRILLAFMTSNYSIPEIQNLVAKGAVIYEDGSIEMPPETYTVKHIFVSATAGIALPEEVKNTLPDDKAGLANGSEVVPGAIEKTEIETVDGTWFFQGWDSERKVIDGSDQRFIGAWAFAKKPEPTSTPEPEKTPEPEATVTPTPTNEPEVAAPTVSPTEPAATDEPKTTKQPVSTSEPEATASPEKTNEKPTEFPLEPRETPMESQDVAKGGGQANQTITFIIIGLIVVVGLAIFVVNRKNKDKEERQ